MSATTNANFFPTIGNVVEGQPTTRAEGEEEQQLVQEIESLCMSCHEQGTTRLLLTSIPYFREVIVVSFRCEHCGTSNNEIQPAGEIRLEGTIYTVRVMVRGDLNRQLVKSQTCTITIPEFDLTLPPGRGQLTTIEGLVREVIADLSIDQPVRKHTDAVTHDKIQAIINGLKTALSDEEEDTDETALASGTVVHHKEEGDVDDNDPVKPFTLRLDDPAGNSFLEFHGSTSDPKWNMRTYARSKQQNIDIGLAQPDDEEAKPTMNTVTEEEEEDNPKLKNEEIYVFPGICSSCGAALDTMMKKVSIPYFQDVLIMSTNCDRCGYRDNEVKSGAAVSEKGRRIILKVEDSEDLSRDILKSETCGMEIPEIELVLNAGTLGGRFTTLEGILNQIYEELSEKVFTTGDSSSGQDRSNFQDFLSNLRAVKSAERPFTLILDDPLANSYLQNLYAPDPDPNMTTEVYERTFDQNEELGINDMRLEGYEDDEAAAKADS